MDTTLVATTAREITFATVDHHTRVSSQQTRFPAGTTVYVTEGRRGELNIRIPGTLFTQTVFYSAIIPA